MNENDLTRLRHMLDSAREAVEFAQGQTRESLDTDRKLLRALEWSTGIIGEAASKISPEYRDAHLNIPWVQIVALRNRLFHGYFDVNPDRLWDTVQVSVPALIAELEKLLPPENDDDT